ncbi:MAG: NAD+ synthase [Verrucomicrobiales bacterium]
MRIGFLQINPTVGDISGNTARVAAGYRRLVEAGAEIIVAPELAITGYPPRDLILKSAFLPKTLSALEELALTTREVPLLVGYVAPNLTGQGAPFLNAAAVLERGKVKHQIAKTRLPTYDVFDEARYFEPADSVQVIELAGLPCGITICEDIWDEDYLPAPLYRRDPAADLVRAGAKLILNLSASPYHLGKPETRSRMLGETARESGVPIVYVNAVGGNDQLVFDGHSLLVGADGATRAILPGFEECERVVELDAPVIKPVWMEPCSELHAALVLGLGDYVRKCGFKSVVLGLSGGIDSAMVAALAAEALGPENVFGVLMPGPFSSDHSISDALRLAANLGITTHTVPIGPMVDAALASFAPVFAGRAPDVTEENLQARLRGVTLMAISNKFGHLLLTTGNKSELAVGYCTIYGDMCGGLAVISDVPKTRIYDLACWMNREKEIIPPGTISKPPSAELRPDQTDQDSLPPYEVLDAILERLVERHWSGDEIIADGFDAETTRRIIRMVDCNEWKRHQAAPGLRVTTKAFGIGRRMPIAQRFRE